MSRIIAMVVILAACSSGKVSTSEDDDGGAIDSGTTALDPDDPTYVRSGPWRATDASIDGDPCGFDAYLTSLGYGYTTAAFLPRTFEVQNVSGGFLIEATAYGLVRAPIFCALDGDQFDCETQAVIPFEDYLYEIDFSGERMDSQTITGTAVVRFGFDAETEDLIAAAGFDMSDCDHSVALTLEFGRF